AAGSWNGTGITSSAAAAAAGGAHRTALGYAEASALGAGSFSGQSVDSTALLVRYTAAGDSDLSGTVDLTDFTFLAGSFGATSGKNWFEGDYNYDGKVDLSDFTYLASNFNYSVPSSSASLGAYVQEPAAFVTLSIIPASL